MSEDFHIFYCWQSDTNSSHGRYLIAEALDEAARRVNEFPGNAFRILIESDATNASGLPDIPETILRRIREADAVVSDLTFIAVSNDQESPKHCSNPNVLFELGYAMHSVGPERLICVMNEAHGEAKHQIFDLAHRRYPIRFTSPEPEKRSRKENVTSLANHLEEAILAVVKLGKVGGTGGDDEIRHERQTAQISTFWQSSDSRSPGQPKFTFDFRPSSYRRRWVNAEDLETAVRELAVRTDRQRLYPPQPTGTSAMDWGIYNDTYGDGWAMTYAGQYWIEAKIGARHSLKLTDYDFRALHTPPAEQTLAEGMWLAAETALPQLARAFAFAARIASVLSPNEVVKWSIEYDCLNGRWFSFGAAFDKYGPCRSPGLSRDGQSTAAEFIERSSELALDVAKDLLDFFNQDGRVISREDLREWINPAEI
ncbi:MAG: hypothetical protein WBD31_21830 [Rubripirellula sp.]